jgi:dolichyl-phosphate-mannose-protein mannosyltransferase
MDSKLNPITELSQEKPVVVLSPNGQFTEKTPKKRTIGYQSEGVTDNDIFSLPSSDWQLLAILTILASFTRLFRIYQPTSVVFDEVQYVHMSSVAFNANSW